VSKLVPQFEESTENGYDERPPIQKFLALHEVGQHAQPYGDGQAPEYI